MAGHTHTPRFRNSFFLFLVSGDAAKEEKEKEEEEEEEAGNVTNYKIPGGVKRKLDRFFGDESFRQKM